MPYSSDAETVLGDEEEDSPLSPCFWTHTAAYQESKHTREDATVQSCTMNASTAAETRTGVDAAMQPARRELRLSPASQLNVLSQISELADVQSRLYTGAAASKPKRQKQRAHVWAPASATLKRKPESIPKAPVKPIAKKQKKSQRKPVQSQAERLAADMVDWETCSEGDLFTIEGDADEQDEWVYEDISDGDFEV